MAKTPLRHILLVEDDPDIQEVTTLLLAEDFDVKACSSAIEALEIAQTFDPDLILLDFMMPGLDGEEAFAEFRQIPITASTPVIFMTARVQPGEISEYRDLGSLGVIPKPFDPDTLVQTIQGMWDRHQEARLDQSRRADLAALRRVYAADLPERLQAIEGFAEVLKSRGWDKDTVGLLYDSAHRLAGSAAIYGFSEVSATALRLCTFVTQQGADGRGDPQSLVKLAAGLSAALKRTILQDQPGLTA
jgi:CheY-like chemotaxis protein